MQDYFNYYIKNEKIYIDAEIEIAKMKNKNSIYIKLLLDHKETIEKLVNIYKKTGYVVVNYSTGIEISW